MAYKDVKPTQGNALRKPIDKDARFRERYPWAAFLAGKWTTDKPTKPGWYPIATRYGDFAGFREYRATARGPVDATVGPNEPGWEGWFWDEPTPKPPLEPGAWDGLLEGFEPEPESEEGEDENA